jgi:aldehyde dehydrogenase (NAD+)
MLQEENFNGTAVDVSEAVLERHRTAARDCCPEDAYGLFIDGSWVDPTDGSAVNAIDATTGEPLTAYSRAGVDDVDRAVTAARRASKGEWGALTGAERADRLEALADQLADERERLGWLDALETGTPRSFTVGSYSGLTAEFYYYFASLARNQDDGNQIRADEDRLIYTTREPYGPVAAIIAWNFPGTQLAMKAAPALAAGNTLVIKPSPRAVLSVLDSMQVFDEVLPDGTINVIPGVGGTVGEHLAVHPYIRKITVTGSVNAGKAVMEDASTNLKSVHFELGGKGPHIIFPDAPLEQAAPEVVRGIFQNQGQFCTAGSRLFLHESIHDEFVDLLLRELDRFVTMGDPMDPETTYGPMIDHGQRDRARSYVEAALEEGATLEVGGDIPEIPGVGDAPFFEPTILTGIKNDDTVAREEVFGPVLSILEWSDRDEVVRLANDTKYGLAAGLWTEELARAHQIANDLEAGTVWVNHYNEVIPAVPFGGYKQSGLGRENDREAFEEYRQTKAVNVSIEE